MIDIFTMGINTYTENSIWSTLFYLYIQIKNLFANKLLKREFLKSHNKYTNNKLIYILLWFWSVVVMTNLQGIDLVNSLPYSRLTSFNLESSRSCTWVWNSLINRYLEVERLLICAQQEFKSFPEYSTNAWKEMGSVKVACEGSV